LTLLTSDAITDVVKQPTTACFCALQSFSVDAKKSATFTVRFHPKEIGNFSHELQLHVKNNPYEQYCVALTGRCCCGGPAW
jgi:hypothetical protein